jgi:hypothetical protein
MTREQLEHLIRAAGDALQVGEIIVIGSQAALGSFPEGLPQSVLMSTEGDVILFGDDPTGRLAEQISGAIGELSRFHETFGIYADGVSMSTGRFPTGWRERLVAVNTPATNGVTGWCAEVHDLVIAKMLAGRPKDIEYTRALIAAGFVKVEVVLERLSDTDATPDEHSRITRFIESIPRQES